MSGLQDTLNAQELLKPVPPVGVMCCVMCHRTKAELVAEVLERNAPLVKGKFPLLFVSYDNDLVCDRCVSERGMVMRYGGEAVVACDPMGTKIYRDTRAYQQANKVPLVDTTNLRDETRFKLEGKLGH